MPNELKHHGRLGQKWGVRNGPPYPLTNSAKRNAYGSESDRKREAGFTPNLVLLSALLAFHGTVALSSIVYQKRVDSFDSEKRDGGYENLSDLKRKETTTSIKEDMKTINPNHRDTSGRTKNCVYCSVAMEMRQRGYDVIARGAKKGMPPGEISKYFKDARTVWPNQNNPKMRELKETLRSSEYDKAAMDNLLDTIKSDGRESRGVFTFDYRDANVGHALYYVSKDGKVSFYDAQSNEERNINEIIRLARPDNYTYIRMDNKKVNENVTELIISRKGK